MHSYKGKKLYILLLLLAVLFSLTSCEKGKSREKYSASFYGAFDTVTTIVGYADSQKSFDSLVAQLQGELQRYSDLYDIYYSYTGITNLRDVNAGAGNEPMAVEKEIIDLLKYSKELYTLTKGQTNIAMGSVLTLWHEAREAGINDPANAAIPGLTALYLAEEHTDINKIVINEEKSTVYLQDSQMSLDVGSIGKGYAVQRLAEYAISLGVKNMLISVGGNVCAIGSHEDGSPWVVGVQNPNLDSAEGYIRTINMEDGMCVVTSGDYQRYYTVDGKKYCHIIDPDSLFPAEYYSSVSIICKDSGLADALSTALFCMEFSEGKALIEDLEKVEAMWIFQDGSIQFSEGFQDYVVGE